MKLIGAITSPYVRKVRIVMAEKKLDYQFLPEDVWSADTTIAASNPLGKVPCLVMEGGEAVFDSRVIVEYLDTLSPVGKLIPTQGRERAEVKTWEALADGVLDAAILARLEATWAGRRRTTAAVTDCDVTALCQFGFMAAGQRECYQILHARCKQRPGLPAAQCPGLTRTSKAGIWALAHWPVPGDR